MTLDQLLVFGYIGYKFCIDKIETVGNRVGITYTKNALTIFIIGLVLCAAVSYLLGTLNFAIIISKLKYKDDIRNYGSGNAGMTNMMRTYGRAAGIFTFLGDLLKAVVAVLVARFLFGDIFAYIAMFFCILGHAFPCWYKFKGGKGVAVTCAAILCLDQIPFLCLLIIFVLIVALTKYLSLGSIMSVLMYPLILSAFYSLHPYPAYSMPFAMISSTLVTFLVLFLHRDNMKRLLNKTENKFSFKKKGTQSDKAMEE
ncbi:MAG: glycerol-3-phosphate 1-O-acyltransferase PlsY [Clostridia bacterium]|nr:glycerol-3-phosphate 1-O-acyltransferase PlsY [Clostridia bacterium]